MPYSLGTVAPGDPWVPRPFYQWEKFGYLYDIKFFNGNVVIELFGLLFFLAHCLLVVGGLGLGFLFDFFDLEPVVGRPVGIFGNWFQQADLTL